MSLSTVQILYSGYACLVDVTHEAMTMGSFWSGGVGFSSGGNDFCFCLAAGVEGAV